MFENMTTVSQGSVGLGLAISYFTINGYVVCVPLNDNQGYDLIVDKDKVERVQVKTTGYKEPGKKVFNVGLRSIRPNKKNNIIKKFDSSKCDLLFVVTSENDQYLIPAHIVCGKSTLSLGKAVEQWKVN